MLALGPKKDGSPNVKFFESPETLNMLEGVRTWLMKNHKKVRTLRLSKSEQSEFGRIYGPGSLVFDIIRRCCDGFVLFLVQYLQADPPTNKTLAALVLQLIQFQEDNLGKNVSKPPLTRLPVSWFDK